MSRRQRRERPAETGFVLVGVVIFVLALTIIGLSLFSLSSYEAQFLQRSVDSEQAFQSALGGIERARYLLCVTSRRDRVAASLPGGEDVVSASAIQFQANHIDTTTTNDLDWDPAKWVLVRVTSEVNGQRRTVEAKFSPGEALNYYRRLVTVGDGIVVTDVASDGTDRRGTVLLDGLVWESSGQDTTVWESVLDTPWPTPIRTSPIVPVPDAGNFMAGHLTAPSAPFDYPYPTHTGSLVFTLNTSPGHLGFWRTDGPRPDWSLYVGFRSEAGGSPDPTADDTHLRIQGFAVWTLPRGAFFQHKVHVERYDHHASTKDCLVIVAGDNGLRFHGGIEAYDVPVILVSSGQVAIRHENDSHGSTVDSYAGDLSVFARSLSLMGPWAEEWDHGYLIHHHMRLRHPPDGLLNSQYISALMVDGALPNAGSSTGHSLALLAGTWRVSAP